MHIDTLFSQFSVITRRKIKKRFNRMAYLQKIAQCFRVMIKAVNAHLDTWPLEVIKLVNYQECLRGIVSDQLIEDLLLKILYLLLNNWTFHGIKLLHHRSACSRCSRYDNILVTQWGNVDSCDRCMR